MGFESEAEMKSVAKTVFDCSFTGGPTTVLEEFVYGGGRTDLVLANESDAYREHRRDVLGIDSAINHDAYLRSFLLINNREEISKEYFYEIGAVDERKKSKALTWLIDNGFVEELPCGKIQTAHNLRRHITRSYAMELKLNKWKRAVKQAFRGKSFSDYQFVVLDEDNIIPAIDNLEVFENYDIGLVSLNTDREFFVHYEPERQIPYSPFTRWKLNETTIWEVQPSYASSD